MSFLSPATFVNVTPVPGYLCRSLFFMKGKETQTIESSLSNQFIVITNESQFVDATQKLVRSSFGSLPDWL